MDVNMTAFLGGNINQILRPYQRVFKCDDKAQSKVYVQELTNHMIKNKLQQRIDNLQTEFHREGKTEALIQKYNGLDYK